MLFTVSVFFCKLVFRKFNTRPILIMLEPDVESLTDSVKTIVEQHYSYPLRKFN